MFQSRQVASMITERTGRAVELVGITTFGDVSRAQLAQIGGTGVFVSGLRACLLAGEIDFAVHSLKDLPAGPAEGIALAAVPPRDDPRDALAARDGAKLADLPPAARIGTGSPRRAAQLLLLRPDLRPVPVRGNAGTRLSRVESARSTRSCSPTRGWPGSAGWTRSPRSSSLTRCSRRPGRARSRWNAARAGRPGRLAGLRG